MFISTANASIKAARASSKLGSFSKVDSPLLAWNQPSLGYQGETYDYPSRNP